MRINKRGEKTKQRKKRVYTTGIRRSVKSLIGDGDDFFWWRGNLKFSCMSGHIESLSAVFGEMERRVKGSKKIGE